MGERWNQFKHPHGRQRKINPLQWNWRDRILVMGELVAFVTAIATIPVELILKWEQAPLLLIGATIIGTAALLWYAFDLISAGEMPLTSENAHTIKQVISAMEMEKEGATFEWDNIDPDGGIPADFSNWSRLRPDIKEVMDKYQVPLFIAAQMVPNQQHHDQPDET